MLQPLSTTPAGNGGGCGAGAVGAVVGELTAQYASNTGMTDPAAITALARVMSATAGLLVSGGDATAVNVAASMGANAAQNNWDMHNTSKQSNGTYVNNATGENYSAQCATTDCLLYGANRNGSVPANIAYDKKVAANGLNALGQAATVVQLVAPVTTFITAPLGALSAAGEAVLTNSPNPAVDFGVSIVVTEALKKMGIPSRGAGWAGSAPGILVPIIRDSSK
ncbi:hypothetical protein [Polynucleobacter sp.]|uniref:hypothetical protein n=1 Tax=Polynucleobacter sp. TaxID=2029855 RepID=UPI0037C606DE